MRLPIFHPNEISEAQRPVYESGKRAAQADAASGFQTETSDGVLIGPWSVLLNFPKLASSFGQFLEGIQAMSGLSPSARQVVILTVGGRFNAAYQLYAHAAAGARAGLRADQIATLSSGGRPVDLTLEQSLAADVTAALLRGGVVPAPLYEETVAQLGQDALDTIVFLAVQYLSVCALLNAYDVPPGELSSWLKDAPK